MPRVTHIIIECPACGAEVTATDEGDVIGAVPKSRQRAKDEPEEPGEGTPDEPDDEPGEDAPAETDDDFP